jgi:hypothetical protein
MNECGCILAGHTDAQNDRRLLGDGQHGAAQAKLALDVDDLAKQRSGSLDASRLRRELAVALVDQRCRILAVHVDSKILRRFRGDGQHGATQAQLALDELGLMKQRSGLHTMVRHGLRNGSMELEAWCSTNR